MDKSPNKPPHILFLFSDTGGGHRSATEAIIEALRLEYGDAYSTEMVDIFKEYAPPAAQPVTCSVSADGPSTSGMGIRLQTQ